MIVYTIIDATPATKRPLKTTAKKTIGRGRMWLTAAGGPITLTIKGSRFANRFLVLKLRTRDIVQKESDHTLGSR